MKKCSLLLGAAGRGEPGRPSKGWEVAVVAIYILSHLYSKLCPEFSTAYRLG